jgi:hypothetical protein
VLKNSTYVVFGHFDENKVSCTENEIINLVKHSQSVTVTARIEEGDDDDDDDDNTYTQHNVYN